MIVTLSFVAALLLLVGPSHSLLRGGHDIQLLMDFEPEAPSIAFADEWEKFTHFQQTFKKKYDTLSEVETRFSIFKANLQDILHHNSQPNITFTMGVNQFTDLTAAEFKELYVGGYGKGNPLGSYGCKAFSSSAAGAPASIDWRDKGAVTSVKDQGQCGSCWTFSSTGAVEGAWAISTGQLIDLSEEQLVDCANGYVTYGSSGCNGGSMDGAFKYITQYGQCSASSYPYTAGTTMKAGSCQKCTPVAHISSCSDVKANDQISLKGAVAMQPVSVAIEADQRYFQSYAGGILTDATKCGQNLDHGVLCVGFGEENGIKYWLVKNSWGASWGENGYVKIARSDSTNDPGVCGITMMASFPTV